MTLRVTKLLTILFILVLSACSGSGDDDPELGGSSDVKITDISSFEFESILWNDYYQGYFEQDILDDKTLGALYGLISDAAAIQGNCGGQYTPIAFNKAADGTFYIDHAINIPQCTEAQAGTYPTSDYTISGTLQEQLSIQHLVVVSDISLDEIDLSGKNLDYIFGFNDVYINQIKMAYTKTISGTLEIDGIAEAGSIHTIYEISKNDDQSLACEVTTSFNCRIRIKTVIDSPTFAQAYESIYSYDVGASDQGQYFDSGTISFKINNWNGSISSMGIGTPPTYNASNGIETIDGSFL